MNQNSLEYLRPDIAKEWNYERNGDLKPSDVTIGSGKRVWFKCEKGHEWQAKIIDRTRTPKGNQLNNTGCPYCNNRKVCKDNCLETLKPDIAKEWNHERNGDLSTEDVLPGSRRIVWWKCKKGHEWKASIVNRASIGQGCPFCAGQKACKDNSLETLRPDIAKEWNYERNGNLKPSDFTIGSGKKIWWKCEKGHEWEAIIKSRVEGTGCPLCSNHGLSFEQMAIYFYLSKVFNNIENRYMYIENEKKYEIDIFIPDLNLGIEYDGYYWHKNSYEKDLNKNRAIEGKIDLIRIRENGLNKINDEKDYVRNDRKYNSLDEAIKYIFGYINTQKESLNSNMLNIPDIDIQSDRLKVESTIKRKVGEMSIASNYPQIAKEFNEERNGGLTANDVSIYSALKVWWKCEKGHEWRASVEKRCGNNNKRKGTGCPYCKNKKVDDTNSLLAKRPDLAKIWDYEKNIGLTPKDVVPTSEKEAYWKCNNNPDHTWYKKIKYVSQTKGIVCPICKEENQDRLSEKRPDLYKQIHDTKNNGLNLSNLTPNSNLKIWWKCEKGHEWQAVIADRNKSKSNRCPKCDKVYLIDNERLKKEWNYEKNMDIDIREITTGSKKKVWWKCEKGHEWEATVNNRVNNRNCPYCSGKKACKDNSLETLRPDIAKEWNYKKNGDLRPSNVTLYSNKKVWWKCVKGHEWETTINHRTSDNRNCPYCSGQKVCKDNSLETLRPDIAKEWNYEKNGDLKPSDFTTGSGKKVWWKCERGHEWQAVIGDRTRGRKCKQCRKLENNEK